MHADSIIKLYKLLGCERRASIVDIGANPIEGPTPYKPLMDAKLGSVIGFEPNEAALATLRQLNVENTTFLPFAIGDGSEQTFNFCRYSGWSSSLVPSKKFLDCFSVFKNNAEVINSTKIKTKRLDDIHEVHPVDYIKMDIQGGELDVFRNAHVALSNAVFIHTEVAFVQLYDKQPMFGDVDVFLRDSGFIPHCFPSGIKNCMISPMVINNDPWKSLNQAIEADIVYVKDFTNMLDFTNGQLKNTALIACACYSSYDLAYRCVLTLEERGAVIANTSAAYINIINDALRRNNA